MSIPRDISNGDNWPAHYRGFRLQVSPNRTVWWQLYNGTDRLQIDPVPEGVVDDLLEVKPSGGRIHVTENEQVLTRIDDGDRNFQNTYVGQMEVDGELIPPDNPEYSIDIQPEGLDVGDLWPSIYEGSRYSFSRRNVWWKGGERNRRHMVDGSFDADILDALNRYKSRGGSFRITPWGDVITLVSMHPLPGQVKEQFDSLPRVTQNIIKLRKERGVDMLPVFVGTIDDPSISVSEPSSLTDELSEEERDSLSSWAGNLGRTSSRSSNSHKATTSSATSSADTGNSDTQSSVSSTQDQGDESDSGDDDQDGNQEIPDEDDLPDDDPVDWMRKEIMDGEDGR